jgi:hypothetical protein
MLQHKYRTKGRTGACLLFCPELQGCDDSNRTNKTERF